MLSRARYFLLALGIVSAVVQPVLGDDKDLIKSGSGSGTPPNLLIVETTCSTLFGPGRKPMLRLSARASQSASIRLTCRFLRG